MRFEAIQLHRYGHFTDQALQFPRQDCDFHLIVGANEAGKSTLRQAFHDLLFGIPMKTSMGFLHPGADLSLGAVLSGGPGELAFGRRRIRRNNGLVDAAGEPLEPEALQPWLGSVNPAFFERMFGLDHQRLELGSRAMLQASDDVDAVLFQAAAGVTALDDVLKDLRAQAEELWANRARNRAWHAAAGRFDDATSRLRAATVRPSAWVDAERESRRLDEAFDRAQSEHSALLGRMRELERLRRLAPLLAQVRQYERRLQEHGETTLNTAALAAHTPEVLRLEQQRPRVGDYRAEIERYQSRMGLLRSQLARLLVQLGRDVPLEHDAQVDALAAQLPTRPLRKELEQLLQEGRQLLADRESAARALEARRHEIQSLRADMDGLPSSCVGAALQQAVDAIAQAGDLAAQLSLAASTLVREETAFLRCLASLRQPGVALADTAEPAVAQLAAMQPWPSASLTAQVQRRQQLQADADNARKRHHEAELEAQAAALAVEQFKRQHQAVTRDEVLEGRRARDAAWEDLLQGRAAMDAQGGAFTALMKHADLLADKQLEAVGDAARLQSLVHEQERRENARDGLAGMLAGAQAAAVGFEAEWAEACAQRGLPPLFPGDMQAWQSGRETALQAHERVQGAEREVQGLQERHDALLKAVVAALRAEPSARGAVTPGAELDLAAAGRAARTLLQQADTVAARRQALGQQLARSESLLPALEQEHERQLAKLKECLLRKQEALARAGLPPGADDAYLEEALLLLADADERVAQLRDCRAEHDRMATELARFDRDVEHLAQQLGEAGAGRAPAVTRVARWSAELEQYRQGLRARDEARQRLDELIDKLLEEGGGRSRAQIEAELDAVDMADISAQSEALEAEVEHAAAARSRLAVEREQARTALDAISGSDAAAQVEAQRQESLADLADIADRYVQLHVQHSLLERVIERYRERRQGPLLARAGELFADLTLGSHVGLVVDGEVEALYARRAEGGLVGLDGLSDGTRDQLYLALRLAALELYLDSAAPMPFIADDLFINYDDGRALAGLQKLAEVARRTQVIFLTHHAHMVELAREGLGGNLNVIELGPATRTAALAGRT